MKRNLQTKSFEGVGDIDTGWTTVSTVSELLTAINTDQKKNVLIKNGNYDLSGTQLNLYSNVNVVGEGLPSDDDNTNLDGVFIHSSTSNVFMAASDGRDLSGAEGYSELPTETLTATGIPAREVQEITTTASPSTIIPAGTLVAFGTNIQELNRLDRDMGIADTTMYLVDPVSSERLDSANISIIRNPVRNISLTNMAVRSTTTFDYVGIGLNGVDGVNLKSVVSHPDSENQGPLGFNCYNVYIDDIQGHYGNSYGMEIYTSRHIVIKDILANPSSLSLQTLFLNHITDIKFLGGNLGNVTLYRGTNVSFIGVNTSTTANENHRITIGLSDNINITGGVFIGTGTIVSITSSTNVILNGATFPDATTAFLALNTVVNATVAHCVAPNLTGDAYSSLPDELKEAGNSWQGDIVHEAITSGAASLYIGEKATAYITILSIVGLVGKALTIDGTTLTYVASAPGSEEIEVGATIQNTIANTQNKINAHATLGPIFFAGQTDWSAILGDTIAIEVDIPGSAGNAYTISDTAGSLFKSTDSFDNGNDPIAIGNATTDGTSYIIGKDCGITGLTDVSAIIASEQCFIDNGNYNTIIGSYDSSISNPNADIYNSSIYGGYQNKLIGFTGSLQWAHIIGGYENIIRTLGASTDSNMILGGNANELSGGNEQAMISCTGSYIYNSQGYSTMLQCYQSEIMNAGYNNFMVCNDNSYIDTGAGYCSIVGSAGSFAVNSASNSACLGGGDHLLDNTTDCAIIGGTLNVIDGGADQSCIIAGDKCLISNSTYICASISSLDSVITTNSTGSCIIGGTYIVIDDTNWALALGDYACLKSDNDYQIVMSYGSPDRRQQIAEVIAKRAVTDATVSVLENGALEISRWAANSSGVTSQQTNAVYSFEIDMTALRTGGVSANGSVGDVSNKKYQGLVKNLAGTVSIVGTVTETTIAYDTNASTWALSFSPSGETLLVQFTGEVDKDITVVTRIKLVEIAI